MAEQMPAEAQQAGERVTVDPTQVAAAGGAAPVPQVVAAPGIGPGAAVPRAEVIPVGGNGAGAVAKSSVTDRERRLWLLLTGGYALVAVGFALVFVVPRFKSALAGRSFLILSVLFLAGGAILVVLGFVRQTVRRL